MGRSLVLTGVPTTSKPSQPRAAPDLETLEAVQRRVLWLATAIVHHANRVRKNRSGVKVGGHQASSASMVSLMTALWFSELRAEDLRVPLPRCAGCGVDRRERAGVSARARPARHRRLRAIRAGG